MGSEQLTGGAPLTVDGIRIDAPGLAGNVVVEPGARTPRRGDRDRVPPALLRALGRHRARPRRTIRIEEPSDIEPGGEGARGARRRPAPIRIAVRRPREGRAQVLLSRDEHGITTWHFPVAPTRGDTLARDGSDLFEIPRAWSSPADRGPGASKIIEVITVPVTKVAGKVIEFKVRDWDHEHHPTMLRLFGPDRSFRELDDAAWRKLEAGRCLLFVHGTFDTVSGAFSRLPDDTLAELHRRYGATDADPWGRVLGFDHPTLADSPTDNARALMEIVGDHGIDADIVCHSRGGLVARATAERPDDLPGLAPRLRVGTAVLVGSTSNGTELANVDRWNAMIDRLTTLLSFAPLPASVDALESIFGLVRSIAVETAHNLSGLDAMSPPRPYLAGLNEDPGLAPGSSYAAITSDYEPSDPALKAFFEDEFKDDVVFRGPNDGMVDIASMVGETIPDPFPVTVTCSFDKAEGIEHANYFGQPKTTTALLDWLKG